MGQFDPALKPQLDVAYQNALAMGLWPGSEALASADAYLSVLAKVFFDPPQRAEAVETGIQTRADLQFYDPLGFAITDAVFRDALWPGSVDGPLTLGPNGVPFDPQESGTEKPPAATASGFDVALENDLEGVFEAAVAQGLWAGTDAAASKEAYLAILGKIYFDPSQRVEAVERGISTLAELQAYDPAGFLVLQAVFGPREDAVIGGDTDDKLAGKETDDTLIGFDGADVMTGGEGEDKIDGGQGFDTATFATARKNISVTLEKDAAVMVADRTGVEGSDALTNIEAVRFGDGGMLDLEGLMGVVNLSAEALMALIELYVAYFDRAPDAEGLFFWGDALSDGMTFEEIAAQFFQQPETVALYGDGSDAALLVDQVYLNCLGRVADAAGFGYWTDKLDKGEVPPEGFILALIAGAKAASGDPADAEYFTAKAKIGAYYAVSKGLTDAEAGKAVMEVYDGTQAGLMQAKTAVDDAFEASMDAEDGAFTLTLIGVLDDPFAL